MGQALTAEAVAQLRNLNKVACQICDRIRDRNTPTCSTCLGATPTRAIQLGDCIPDTRRNTGISNQQERANETNVEIVHPSTATSDDAEDSPTVLVSSVTLPQRFSELVDGLFRNTREYLPAAVASKYCVAWAESVEGMLVGDASWGMLAR